ncbi:NAD(P)/FAD-dependent oxidoreductase [Desulfobulbus sp.]|uniref:NAD(P)/FAD-dependent oxidoreductase n=1 Tax=Desulfobulbus sp. TaxID=895 RepID=UPI00286F9888|nr:NAD(P)/FAD-dependent oxidoreductase [Desulfobulbus sp.]
MAEQADVLVVGGGPGGLACATLLAQRGARVVLAERKPVLGPKVCAGGLTWHGLLRHVPESLIERSFAEQDVRTPWQRVKVAEPDPIVATVDRQRLGQWMAEQALAAGVAVRAGTKVADLELHRAILETAAGGRSALEFRHLVGADGSTSLVRRFLGLPVAAMGIGLNCTHPGTRARMEWHLNPRRFGAGYGWIFPHRHTVSIGAYGDSRQFSGRELKGRLLRWAAEQGFRLDSQAIRAGLVNYDYQGVRFDRGWLVGDAAGLASGLTGEGIYPALVSGQAVARMILDPNFHDQELARLAVRHRQHRRMTALATDNPRLSRLLLETMALLLRTKIIDFRLLEMAD